MKIIGHRGAASLALENTLQSISIARETHVDAIEIDVRLTADGQFVLSHDANLLRVSGTRMTVASSTLEELRTIELKNGETIATLPEAIKEADGAQMLIEVKGSRWADELATELQRYDGHDLIVIARDHEELHRFHVLMSHIPVYLVQRFNPIDVLQALQDAKEYGFTGVDLNFWLLNPLTYWLAKRYKLDVIVYTVDFTWIARFLLFLFPGISITTNRPHRLIQLKWNKTT